MTECSASSCHEVATVRVLAQLSRTWAATACDRHAQGVVDFWRATQLARVWVEAIPAAVDHAP